MSLRERNQVGGSRRRTPAPAARFPPPCRGQDPCRRRSAGPSRRDPTPMPAPRNVAGCIVHEATPGRKRAPTRPPGVGYTHSRSAAPAPWGVVAPGRRHGAPRAVDAGGAARQVHAAGPHPQLLHHRPHRPRQVDAGRPPAGADRHARRSARWSSRCSTSMDLEREKGITIKAKAVRMHYLRARRRRVRAQPDRHARPRRLHLRGVAQPGRLRGRAAGRRRRPGHRGADAGQRLPGARARPRDHPGHQQDRPAQRRARAGRRGDRATSSACPARRCILRLGQGGHRRRRRSSRRSSSACRRPRATGTRRCAR